MGYEDKHWLLASDKLMHVIAGGMVAQFAMALFMLIGLKVCGCIVIGFLTSVMVSFAKECVYDNWFGRGVPSKQDFLAGVYGGFVGTLFGAIIALI